MHAKIEREKKELQDKEEEKEEKTGFALLR